MKNIVIIILSIIALAELFMLNSKKDSSDYWFQRAVASEDVIYRVYEDNDTYVLDVLSESNEWDIWTEIASQQEERG